MCSSLCLRTGIIGEQVIDVLILASWFKEYITELLSRTRPLLEFSVFLDNHVLEHLRGVPKTRRLVHQSVAAHVCLPLADRVAEL